MKHKTICILGGTGFVGRHLTTALTAAGYRCLIPSRHPQRHKGLGVTGAELVQTPTLDQQRLTELLAGCDCAINLVGILNQAGGGQSFRNLHLALAQRLVEACKASGVDRLLHMSALNADRDKGTSHYLKSKGEAEELVHETGPPQLRVTSFRPSVIFGIDDSFFNRFAALLQLAPGPFPLACPDARFAPVFVGDVVAAFLKALQDPATWGRRYDLCGPRTLTLKELVHYTADNLGAAKPIIGLGDRLSRLQARLFGLLPGRPFTYDNYLSLQLDSVCSDDGLGALGIEATDMDAVVPFYLGGRSERQRYQQLRQLS